MIDYTLPLEKLPDPLPIEPLRKPFDVTITPPGSKSITNRAYVLAALAQGESRIIRPLRADDTDLLLKALCTLGAEARWEGEDVLIKGVNGRFPRGGHVNLGDGGTPTRFMIACACLAAEPVVVDGSQRMRERPIAEGVNMLRQLGAKVEYLEAEGRLPVRVVPSNDFVGGELRVGRTQTSQFVSALLLIGPLLRDGLCIDLVEEPTSYSYISLTTTTLREWGVMLRNDVEWREPENDNPDHFSGDVQVWHEPLLARRFVIEPDASSAVYWWVAAALCDNSSVYIPGFRSHSSQPDWRVLLTLDYALLRDASSSGENDGFRAICRQSSHTMSRFIEAQSMPDGAMALAVAATAERDIVRISGLHTLRVKETDRIAALATELGKIGCETYTGEDWISINTRGPESRATKPVVIETYNDHRMAMAFAVLGLARPGISIRNPACVRKSYPTFWRDFAKLYQ